MSQLERAGFRPKRKLNQSGAIEAVDTKPLLANRESGPSTFEISHLLRQVPLGRVGTMTAMTRSGSARMMRLGVIAPGVPRFEQHVGSELVTPVAFPEEQL